MPFWWNRRRKFWAGRWRRRRRNTRYKRRKYPRRRYRRPYGRRRRRYRRRKHKVRRKKKTITIKQWQPDSIRKCKVKLVDCFIIGAQGTQFKCYSNEAKKYPQPKQPSGGGFGMEVFTLEDLYLRYKAHKCIWTATNDYKDLVRFTGSTFTFYRHEDTDFIISYNTQPPFSLDKYTYTSIHPINMLLQKKKKILYSLKTKPWGPSKVKVKIKPPKQMSTKWFFQKFFATAGLLELKATACDLKYSYISNTAVNTNLSIVYLNTGFYQLSDWGKALSTHAYKPFSTIDQQLKFWYKSGNQTKHATIDYTTYYKSIHYDTGAFQAGVLNAYLINKTTASEPPTMATLPVAVARYNPQLDTGEKNELWVVSILTQHYDKPREPQLIYSGYPLWMMFFGYYNYILQYKGDQTFLNSHMFVIRSPAILKLSTTAEQDYFPFIDFSFLNGKMPFQEYLDEQSKKFWYPSVKKQIETINAIVQCGPYIPKYADNKNSTWELKYRSTFYFKFGGPQITDQPVVDPQKQEDYDVPDKFKETIQISDPISQACEQMFHDWDYRRGFITSTAIKRMSEHLKIDSDVSSTSTEPPHKKTRITAEVPCAPQETQKIKSCLLSLCEEDIYQEEEDLHKLIKQQHKKQQQLKQQLLQLLAEMNKKQAMLQLQTGIFG
nr:MAG: ORF1 [Torque teno midi virus]